MARPATISRGEVYMDTLVRIDAIGANEALVDRAFGWFGTVERRCSRFDPASELSRLSRSPVSVAHPVSPLLFSVLEFALAVAETSGGAFDPTVGHALESSGFNRNYVTQQEITTRPDAGECSYRDVLLDAEAQTVTLLAPVVLDLGAVAKGYAMDLAAAEFAGECADFVINAGGDVLAHGRNADDEPWRIGIRHPRQLDALIDTLVVSDAAVCTSGDYERKRPAGAAGHHIVDPLAAWSAARSASVTVVAPSAMLADALSTAAFVLAPEQALDLLREEGVEGLIVTAELERIETAGFGRYRA